MSARDEAGKPIEATVIVDDEELGTTLRQYRVPLCSKKLEVKTGPRKFTRFLSLSQGSVSHVVVDLNLDPDCDVNSYVDSKYGGYFWPVISVSALTLVTLSSLWVEYPSFPLTFGFLGLIPASFILRSRYHYRQEAFKDYKPPAKCQAGLQSSRNHLPPKHVSSSIKLAPILAPSTDGVTFGLSGTF